MPVKVLKPTTPGRRKAVFADFSELTTDKPHKGLVGRAKKRCGRNNQGRITVRHRGGGNSRKYRIIDFKQNKIDIPAKVETIEYDPNRSARIALVAYRDGERAYIIAPDSLKVGDMIVTTGTRGEAKVGNRMPLMHIPEGVFLHNIELVPGGGAKMARSGGASVQLMGIEGKYAQLRLPSKEVRRVSKNCLATIGKVSNSDHRLTRRGKAGITRKKGIRPTVRGKAMNPVDHPHGGGEARNSIGLTHPKTPWGKHALGVKTRKKKKASNKFILKRRNAKK